MSGYGFGEDAIFAEENSHSAPLPRGWRVFYVVFGTFLALYAVLLAVGMSDYIERCLLVDEPAYLFSAAIFALAILAVAISSWAAFACRRQLRSHIMRVLALSLVPVPLELGGMIFAGDVTMSRLYDGFGGLGAALVILGLASILLVVLAFDVAVIVHYVKAGKDSADDPAASSGTVPWKAILIIVIALTACAFAYEGYQSLVVAPQSHAELERLLDEHGAGDQDRGMS